MRGRSEAEARELAQTLAQRAAEPRRGLPPEAVARVVLCGAVALWGAGLWATTGDARAVALAGLCVWGIAPR